MFIVGILVTVIVFVFVRRSSEYSRESNLRNLFMKFLQEREKYIMAEQLVGHVNSNSNLFFNWFISRGLLISLSPIYSSCPIIHPRTTFLGQKQEFTTVTVIRQGRNSKTRLSQGETRTRNLSVMGPILLVAAPSCSLVFELVI